MRAGATRADRVWALLEARAPGTDALLVVGDANRRYLSGFRGDAGWLWIGRDVRALVADGRFWAQAEEEAPAWRLVRAPRGDLLGAVGRLAAEGGVRSVAFEADRLTHEAFRRLRRTLKGVRLRPLVGLVEELRVVKEPEELGAIRRAAELTDRAFQEWLPLVRPGAVEAELALELEVRLRRLGAEGVAFPPIVASGPRAAMAHAIPGPGRLEAGELVVVDVGARVDGYCSDMTRTVVVPGAPPSGEARRVGAVVAQALEAGLRALRAGVPGVAVDRAARAVIEGEGFGEAFEHSTGHGVGLEVHEPPRLGPSAPPRARVPAGAVVTVEPGVYLPGRLGVRLEELAWVGPDGPETLSRTPLGIW